MFYCFRFKKNKRIMSVIIKKKKQSPSDYKEYIDNLEEMVTGRSNIYKQQSWNPSESEVHHNGRKLNVVT